MFIYCHSSISLNFSDYFFCHYICPFFSPITWAQFYSHKFARFSQITMTGFFSNYFGQVFIISIGQLYKILFFPLPGQNTFTSKGASPFISFILSLQLMPHFVVTIPAHHWAGSTFGPPCGCIKLWLHQTPIFQHGQGSFSQQHSN